MPEIIGGGGALLDADVDGDLDLYFVQGKGPNAMWRNDGDGTFTPWTNGTEYEGYGMGVATGDVDGDGDIDLFVTNLGPNVLLLNTGDGTFEEAPNAGVEDDGWGASAAFFDADTDGDLDLFVVNYLAWTPDTALDCVDAIGSPEYCSPNNFMAPTVDRLYINDGKGTFTDVTESAGISTKPGTGLGIVATDFDQNGTMDIFVANDLMPDHLWTNNGDGTFTEIGMQVGVAIDDEGKPKAGMGVDIADIDDDGDFDLIVCNLRNESDSLFRNDGQYFVDITTRAGLRANTRANTRFGLGFVDFNNDGHIDLYEANGAVLRPQHLPESGDPYAQRNLLLAGTATGRFEPTAVRAGVEHHEPLTSRGAIFGDIDRDGKIDVVVVNRDAPARVYRNITPDSNWLGVDVRRSSFAPALGAVVQVRLVDRMITVPVQTASSYMTASDHLVHVGLGDFDQVNSITVTMPPYLPVQVPGPIRANQVLRVDIP